MKRFVDGQEVELSDEPVEIVHLDDCMIVKTKDGAFSAVAVQTSSGALVSYKGRQYKIERSRGRAGGAGAAASGELRAPMPGQIVDVKVRQGQSVQIGETVLVLEAMKTQQPFTAPFTGTIARLEVKPGDQVLEGALLALVEPDE